MISFLSWLEQKGLNEQDSFANFEKQKQASIAQALASSGDRPNLSRVAQSVTNDPKLKKVTPIGAKPDEETIKKDINTSLVNQKKQQMQTNIQQQSLVK
jgi:hypothetical protein